MPVVVLFVGIAYDIKVILEAEKHRELYDLQGQGRLDKDQCWDIANTMFMYHFSVKESS